MTELDTRRALLLQGNIFTPFYVTSTYSLQDALMRGKVRLDAPVLAVERDTEPLVLLTRQLSYHHVAQGEGAGEPWMVSF
jgi:hypothetical protein